MSPPSTSTMVGFERAGCDDAAAAQAQEDQGLVRQAAERKRQQSAEVACETGNNSSG
jgi:hypothetical protein